MRILILAAVLAAVIQPATAQTIRTECNSTTANGTTRTVCTTGDKPYTVPSSLTPQQQVTAYGARWHHDVKSSLTSSQQVLSYGARYGN